MTITTGYNIEGRGGLLQIDANKQEKGYLRFDPDALSIVPKFKQQQDIEAAAAAHKKDSYARATSEIRYEDLMVVKSANSTMHVKSANSTKLQTQVQRSKLSVDLVRVSPDGFSRLTTTVQFENTHVVEQWKRALHKHCGDGSVEQIESMETVWFTGANPEIKTALQRRKLRRRMTKEKAMLIFKRIAARSRHNTNGMAWLFVAIAMAMNIVTWVVLQMYVYYFIHMLDRTAPFAESMFVISFNATLSILKAITKNFAKMSVRENRPKPFFFVVA